MIFFTVLICQNTFGSCEIFKSIMFIFETAMSMFATRLSIPKCLWHLSNCENIIFRFRNFLEICQVVTEIIYLAQISFVLRF